MTAFAGLEPVYVAQQDYNARHDADFPDVVIGHLLRHIGEWCQLGRVFNADVWAVRDAVEVARRIGINVLGDRQRGYCVPAGAPFRRVRYLRVERASEWPVEETPGQLSLCGRVG